MVGVTLQVVYIALVIPGGTVSADVRAISYIGVPLAILFVHATNITDEVNRRSCSSNGAVVGTPAFLRKFKYRTWYGNNIGWKVEEGKTKNPT